MLGDVAGQHVVDAACGPGRYAEELVARGARVTGFDLSPRMVELSRGWKVRYWLAPLERTCEELREAGFLIEQLREGRPPAEAASVDPERHARLARESLGFLTVRAIPRVS